MIRRIVLTVLSIMFMANLHAQEIKDTVVNVGAQSAPGYIATLSQEMNTVRDVMKKRMKDAGLKTTNSEGYTACLGQIVNDIATVPINLYVKVEEQGRKSDKTTVVTICAMPMNIADKVDNMNTFVRRYLENLIRDAEHQEALDQLNEEEKNLKKAEKEYNKAVSELESTNKSIKSSQDKIVSNKKNIEKLNDKIKEYEEDNKKLESAIEKDNDRKSDAEKRVSETQGNLKEIEAKVNQMRARLQ